MPAWHSRPIKTSEHTYFKAFLKLPSRIAENFSRLGVSRNLLNYLTNQSRHAILCVNIPVRYSECI